MKIDKALLKATLLIAGKKDVRYYLNGAYIEQAQGGVWVVATEGHMLFAAWQASDELLGAPSVLIPRDALTAALKLDKEDTLDVTAKTLGALAYVQLDGVFPAWRRVLPGDTVSGQHPTGFDAHLLSEAVKAMNVANGVQDHGLNVAIFADTESYVVRGRRAKCLVKVMAARNVLKYDDKSPVVYEPLGA